MLLPLNANFEGEAVRSRELPGLRIETWGTRRIAALDLELFLIVRQEGEIIGKLRGGLRSGVRDQKINELGWGGQAELGRRGVDSFGGVAGFGGFVDGGLAVGDERPTGLSGLSRANCLKCSEEFREVSQGR